MRTELPPEHRDTVARAAAPERNATPLAVSILSSYTANNLKDPLQYFLARAGFNPTVRFGGYQQYNQELRDQASALHKDKPAIIVLALSSRSLFPELPFAPGTSSYEATRTDALRKIDDILASIATAAPSLRASFLVTTLEPVAFSSYGLRDAAAADGAQAIIDACNDRLREAARSHASIALLDFAGVVNRFGHAQLTDEKLWYAGKILLTNSAAVAFAEELAGIIGALLGKTKKCIVVDLDNTLWGGVVGEDGVDGIVLDDESTMGKIYRDIQRTLLAYRKSGILLAAVSKNNHEDALAAFQHPDMVLQEDDFAALRINWATKSENIRAVAEELNIGLDSVLFVDDNPAERLEVAQRLPDVDVLAVPADLAQLPLLLQRTRSLQQYAVSDEDRKRHELYVQDRKRIANKPAAGTSGTNEDYLHSLKTEIEVKGNDLASLSRITQLINKTNQFNLRTQRYTEAQVKDLMTDGKHLVASVRVWDAFGELGLTGVLIFEQQGQGAGKAAGTRYFVDTFLLSCRILSRGIERQFFTEAVRLLAQQREAEKGALTLEGEFLPTPKNSPAKDIYPQLGFAPLPAKNSGPQSVGIRYEAHLDISRLDTLPYITVRP